MTHICPVMIGNHFGPNFTVFRPKKFVARFKLATASFHFGNLEFLVKTKVFIQNLAWIRIKVFLARNCIASIMVFLAISYITTGVSLVTLVKLWLWLLAKHFWKQVVVPFHSKYWYSCSYSYFAPNHILRRNRLAGCLLSRTILVAAAKPRQMNDFRTLSAGSHCQ